MSIDFEQFKPVLNRWYSGRGEYSGDAILTTSSGKLYQGTSIVSWDDTDRAEISVELIGVSPQDVWRPIELESIAIKVTGPEGTFKASRAFVINSSMHFSSKGGTPPKLTLIASESKYEPHGALVAAYWVAPLVNFISDFRYRSPATDNHPLRLFPTPAVPPELNEMDRIRAQHSATSRNKLIPFTFSGKPGFVEQLPEYSGQVAALESGARRKAATAILVGGIPEGALADIDALKEWFPYSYLHALSVASGTHVGLPFIELRSAEGILVERIHLSSNVREYVKGQSVIHELFCKAGGKSPTGTLMEALESSLATKRYLQTVASYAVAASARLGPLEDYADCLVRALETLTTAEDVAKQNLLDGVPDASTQKVKTILGNAAASIRQEAAQLRASLNVDAADRLTRIADRTRSSDQKEAMFGLAVVELLRKYGLEDGVVVNTVLTARTPPSSWAQILSKIRGAAIHTGYFELEDREELFSLYAFIRHLHDVVIRLLLMGSGYTGTYQPLVAQWVGEGKPLDWVKATITPAELRLG